MSNNKKSGSEEESSSRVIDSFIRQAVDSGELDPDDFDNGSKNVFWDRTTIRAALGGLAVLVLVNLFFYYNMRLEQVDNTSDWMPERRGFLVEYREGQTRLPVVSPTVSTLPLSVDAETSSLTESSTQNVENLSELAEAEVASAPVAVSDTASENSQVQVAISEQIETETTISADSPEEEIRARVLSWAQSWSDKDVDAYLEHYSSDFISQGGAPYAPWAELRHERILAPDWIGIGVSQFRVSVNNQSAVAEFVQEYNSPDFSSESLKTLVFEINDGTWKIIRETVQPQ